MHAFTDAVARELKGVRCVSPGHSNQCDTCPQGYECDEGHFSRAACESCGSTLGGNRYAAHGFVWVRTPRHGRMEELVHFDICVDCLMYHANGEVPENWTED